MAMVITRRIHSMQLKKITLILFLIGACFFAGAQTRVVWTCPMHPQIQKSGPGNCPICGMTLVKKTIKVAPSRSAPRKQEAVRPQANEPANREMKDRDMKKDTAQKREVHDHEMKMDTAQVDGAHQIQNKVHIVPGKTVRYDLYVKDTLVKFTGKSKKAIAINGSIPGPTLTFTEGDTAEIYLHNQLKEETSLH